MKKKSPASKPARPVRQRTDTRTAVRESAEDAGKSRARLKVKAGSAKTAKTPAKPTTLAKGKASAKPKKTAVVKLPEPEVIPPVKQASSSTPGEEETIKFEGRGTKASKASAKPKKTAVVKLPEPEVILPVKGASAKRKKTVAAKPTKRSLSAARPPKASRALPLPVKTVESPTVPARQTVAPPEPVVEPKRSRAEQPPSFSCKIPAILLEGDEPVPAEVVKIAPAARHEPPPAAPLLQFGADLHLTARDPRCLYASWDLTFEEQRACNSRSADHHLVLRARVGGANGPIAAEVHVHPESQHWFLHVDQAGTAYVGELGYYTPDRQWVTLAVSKGVSTPSDVPTTSHLESFLRVAPQPAPEAGMAAAFAPSPAGPAAAPEQPAQPAACAPPQAITRRWEQPVASVSEAAPETSGVQTPPSPAPGGSLGSHPAAQAFAPLQIIAAMPAPRAPFVEPAAPPPRLTPEQEELLETVILTLLRPDPVSSVELAEQHIARLKSRPAGEAGPSSITPPAEAAAPLGVSSPGGEAPAPTGAPNFWFTVNAELVIYGATEPDATVTIGGRAIRLRPDGSFSYRFALPDGEFKLPIAAVSTQGDQRAAQLRFSRGTTHTGQVGAHPQDPSLKPPAPENIA